LRPGENHSFWMDVKCKPAPADSSGFVDVD
jgi:hypothetical protein